MNFYKETIATSNGTIVYWDTKNDANNILILLAPGASTGEVFTKINISSYPNIRFIAPNFPGRGGTTFQLKYSQCLQVCASLVSTLLTELKIEKVDILGISFGSMVANYLFENSNNLKINKSILIAPGEYFNTYQRCILNLIFWPTKWIFFQKLYFFLLNKFLPSLKETKLSVIRNQWIETLQYKIDTSTKCALPITAYICKRDSIATTNSKIKLMNKYLDMSIVTVDREHPLKQKVITELIDLAVKNLYS